jgi:3-hydroxyacyl-CoA dehydrogenase
MSETVPLPPATGSVTYDIDGDVAVLRIDNPPVNSSTVEVRAGLLAGITRAADDSRAVAVVLIGTNRAFISGSDLREFDGPLSEPQLPQVIGAIEECGKPVVAALTGATLGGGFELALGCDARVAASSAVLGLPEVGLGMIPGAGGTQRLPRLVGSARALELVCSGQRLSAGQALDEGIVDAIAETDVLASAVDHARTRATKRALTRLPVPADPPGAVESAVKKALAQGRGRPQTVAAVGAVLLAAAVPAPVALRHERAEFNRLRLGREAAALRHLFFAERATAREYRSANTSTIRSVGVIGAGTMGTGIARALLDAGLEVVLVEADTGALAAGTQRLADGYHRSVHRGRLPEAVMRDRLDRLATSVTVDAVRSCEVVIEAVYEDLAVKKSVLAQVDAVVGPTTVVASNTSYLDLDELAASTDLPGRVVGMHFLNPAHAAKVVEVVRGTATTPDVMAAAVSLTRQLGKAPIIAGVGFGFIGNRVFNAYRYQCELMLEEGAFPHQVDRALEEFGFAMGPFAVADMSGLDIAWRMRKSLAAHRDPEVRYVPIADSLCEQGRLGQKTGKGWYRYETGSTRPLHDPAVDELISKASAHRGIGRRSFTDAEIADRAVLAMANETALLLDEGIAARPSDVDLMMTSGYGFPRHRGGPAFWASHQDPGRLRAALEGLRAATGPGFVAGDLRLLTTGRTT